MRRTVKAVRLFHVHSFQHARRCPGFFAPIVFYARGNSQEGERGTRKKEAGRIQARGADEALPDMVRHRRSRDSGAAGLW